jgi:tetratricopeptide (TPR) repeat protein
MLVSLHFAEPMQVTSLNPAEDKRRQDLNRINTLTQSYVTLGSMAAQDENIEQSLSFFQSAGDLWATYPDVFCRQLSAVAKVMFKHQLDGEHTDEAVSTMQTLIERLEPYDTNAVLKELDSAYPVAGELLYVQKDYSKAEEMYRKAANLSLRLDNKEEAANRLNLLAYCLAYQEKYDEALQTIDRAIETQPDVANLYDSKGEILLMMGNKKEAKKMWEKVIAIDPDFAKNNETVLYQKLFKKK